MGYLQELTDFKEELITIFLMDEMLMRAVVHPEKNRLSIPVENPMSYVYKNIYPYKHTLDETQENKQTFITMDFVNFGLVNNYFKDLSIAIYVFTHKDLMVIEVPHDTVPNAKKNVLRTDYILQRIEQNLNKRLGFGIGRLNFGGLSSVRITDKVSGSVILYNTTEFDRK